MRASALAALGLAAYSAFLVATIPAAYVTGQIQAAYPRAIEIADAQGTLWRGSARVRLAPARSATTIDRAEWRFVPLRLFAGEIAFQVQASAVGLTAAMEVARSPSTWHLRAAKVEGDAAGLATLVPLLAPWRPSGPIALSAPEIAIRWGREVKGSLEAEWRDAVTGLSEVRPIGSYRASWRGDSASGNVSVTTTKGPLRITGAGTTTPALRMAFRGDARGEGESAKALEPLLDLMGPRRPDGARALDLRIE